MVNNAAILTVGTAKEINFLIKLMGLVRIVGFTGWETGKGVDSAVGGGVA
jgi:hypothetical protein